MTEPAAAQGTDTQPTLSPRRRLEKHVTDDLATRRVLNPETMRQKERLVQDGVRALRPDKRMEILGVTQLQLEGMNTRDQRRLALGYTSDADLAGLSPEQAQAYFGADTHDVIWAGSDRYWDILSNGSFKPEEVARIRDHHRPTPESIAADAQVVEEAQEALQNAGDSALAL